MEDSKELVPVLERAAPKHEVYILRTSITVTTQLGGQGKELARHIDHLAKDEYLCGSTSIPLSDFLNIYGVFVVVLFWCMRIMTR